MTATTDWIGVILLFMLALAACGMIAGFVGVIWYLLWEKRKDTATCGKCGYAVRGVSQLTCPECGSDLREVGIRPPR